MMLFTVLIFNVIIIGVVIIGINKYVKPQQKDNANLMNEGDVKKTDNNELLDSNEAIRNEIITLIKDLNNLGELSLMETAQKLDEIHKILDTNKLEKNLKKLRFQKYEIENKIRQDKRSQFRTNKQENKSKYYFLTNTILTILSPLILFFVTCFVAYEVSSHTHISYFYASPFDWENTWWVWVIFMILIIRIENKLFSRRQNSIFFSKNSHILLFYLSSLSTILANINYVGLILSHNDSNFMRLVWYDGILLDTFIFTYTLPVFFWGGYYVIIKYNDAFKALLYKIQQKRNRESKLLKREKAITELKEAKDLFDLGILSKEEYDDLSKKLKPSILDN